MSLRDTLLPVVYSTRSIPGQLGLRPHAVFLVTTTWPGAQTGEGTKTVSAVPLTEANGYPPKVRWLKTETLVLEGLDAGSCVIGPITPDFSGGGNSIGVIEGASTANQSTFHIVIVGPTHPSGAKYRVVASSSDHALHYTLTASPVAGATAADLGLSTGNFIQVDGSGFIQTDALGFILVG